MLHAEKQNRQEIASVLTHIYTILTREGYEDLCAHVHADAQGIDLISI